MIFNSFLFFIFLAIVFFTYWFILKKSLRLQNLFLLIASYVFYGWWDYRFLSLILFSTIVDYFVAQALDKQENQTKRKWLVGVSLFVNLGLLGFFKYYNFFVDNFVQAFAGLGVDVNITTLKIILPVGISFYTFQTLSYTIDVYRKKLAPVNDFISFGAYVSFFPQLVAGPIERAPNLVPQFQSQRVFDYDLAKDGVKQMLWGMFKKVVIADSCGLYANYIFDHHESLNSVYLVLGSIFFAFQIYGDFSGYSDIAIGTAKLFGFKLMTNFKYPYFSRDMAEFWRRWHISLSTWFRDYLYIPMGGSRGSKMMQLRNTMTIFLVSGFWHGANWTFIFWGGLHAVYFIPLLLRNKNRKNIEVVAGDKLIPSFKDVTQILSTFLLACLAWIFFRADNITEAFSYIGNIFQNISVDQHMSSGWDVLLLIGLMLMVEWTNRHEDHPLRTLKMGRPMKLALYFVLFFLVVAFFNINNQEFIYFQF